MKPQKGLIRLQSVSLSDITSENGKTEIINNSMIDEDTYRKELDRLLKQSLGTAYESTLQRFVLSKYEELDQKQQKFRDESNNDDQQHKIDVRRNLITVKRQSRKITTEKIEKLSKPLSMHVWKGPSVPSMKLTTNHLGRQRPPPYITRTEQLQDIYNKYVKGLKKPLNNSNRSQSSMSLRNLRIGRSEIKSKRSWSAPSNRLLRHEEQFIRTSVSPSKTSHRKFHEWLKDNKEWHHMSSEKIEKKISENSKEILRTSNPTIIRKSVQLSSIANLKAADRYIQFKLPSSNPSSPSVRMDNMKPTLNPNPNPNPNPKVSATESEHLLTSDPIRYQPQPSISSKIHQVDINKILEAFGKKRKSLKIDEVNDIESVSIIHPSQFIPHPIPKSPTASFPTSPSQRAADQLVQPSVIKSSLAGLFGEIDIQGTKPDEIGSYDQDAELIHPLPQNHTSDTTYPIEVKTNQSASNCPTKVNKKVSLADLFGNIDGEDAPECAEDTSDSWINSMNQNELSSTVIETINNHNKLKNLLAKYQDNRSTLRPDDMLHIETVTVEDVSQVIPTPPLSSRAIEISSPRLDTSMKVVEPSGISKDTMTYSSPFSKNNLDAKGRETGSEMKPTDSLPSLPNKDDETIHDQMEETQENIIKHTFSNVFDRLALNDSQFYYRNRAKSPLRSDNKAAMDDVFVPTMSSRSYAFLKNTPHQESQLDGDVAESDKLEFKHNGSLLPVRTNVANENRKEFIMYQIKSSQHDSPVDHIPRSVSPRSKSPNPRSIRSVKIKQQTRNEILRSQSKSVKKSRKEVEDYCKSNYIPIEMFEQSKDRSGSNRPILVNKKWNSPKRKFSSTYVMTTFKERNELSIDTRLLREALSRQCSSPGPGHYDHKKVSSLTSRSPLKPQAAAQYHEFQSKRPQSHIDQLLRDRSPTSGANSYSFAKGTRFEKHADTSTLFTTMTSSIGRATNVASSEGMNESLFQNSMRREQYRSGSPSARFQSAAWTAAQVLKKISGNVQ